MTITPDELVQREVIYCVSPLMCTLISKAEAAADLLEEDVETLYDLASRPNYEAAVEDFLRYESDADQTERIEEMIGGKVVTHELAKEICQEFNLEYDYDEVYEFWLVSRWLGEKLNARGETVREFAGMTIWGRCTTGQSISLDWVIEDICNELNKGESK